MKVLFKPRERKRERGGGEGEGSLLPALPMLELLETDSEVWEKKKDCTCG